MKSTKKIARRINGLNWVKVGRWIQAPLFAWSNITGRSREFNLKTLGFDFEYQNFLFLNSEYHFEESENEKLKEFFNQNLKDDANWFRKYEAIVRDVSQSMIDFSAQHKDKDFSKFSAGQLKELFQEFYLRVNLAQPVLEGYQLLGELLEARIRANLEDYFSRANKKPDLIDEYLKYLNVPKHKIAMVQEEEDFLSLVAKMQLEHLTITSREFRSLFDEHLEKYRWISTHHFIGDPYDEQFFWRRLEEHSNSDCTRELKRRYDQSKSYLRKHEALKAELSKEKDILSDIEIAQDLSYLKPFRVEAYYIAWTNLWGLFSEISKRLGIANEDLMALTDTEIVQAIDTGVVNKAKINERKKDFAIVKLDGQLEIFSGNSLKEIKSKLHQDDHSGETHVTGAMAYEGRVIGLSLIHI